MTAYMFVTAFIAAMVASAPSQATGWDRIPTWERILLVVWQ
jgi:hypothetical protein